MCEIFHLEYHLDFVYYLRHQHLGVFHVLPLNVMEQAANANLHSLPYFFEKYILYSQKKYLQKEM